MTLLLQWGCWPKDPSPPRQPMRSPFPGMDPYVEDQGRWNDFHAAIITYICDAINESLPEDYVAQMGEEVRVVTWQEGPESAMRPDIVDDEVRDTWVEIRRLPDERLVTAIEVLS